MYYVEGAHEPIVPPEVFDRAQEEIRRRAEGKKHTQAQLYPFSGKILCERCGKHFRRKTTKSGVKWSCSTYNTYGKAYCDAQQIPDPILQSIIGERPFSQIIVPEDGVVRVIWENGEESVHHWQNPSRSESWTEEMRQMAAERTRQWHQNQ